MTQCPTCQHLEIEGALFCSECGSQLVFTRDEAAVGTIVYPKKGQTGPQMSQVTQPMNRPPENGGARLTLRVVESGELIPLPPGKEATLGRLASDQPIVPDVDLSQYKAYECGVSRLHASVRFQANEFQVVDLGSANGTRLNGNKLPGHTPFPLNNGDILILGKLKLQVILSS
jgi:pSer/pThr/pTyr-binding forkhead associated (FHA) protein